MLDPVQILQNARNEATAVLEGEDWTFVFDLICNAVGHVINLPAFVHITHTGQPVVAALETVDLESDLVDEMEREADITAQEDAINYRFPDEVSR